jgi:hypothetical protein
VARAHPQATGGGLRATPGSPGHWGWPRAATPVAWGWSSHPFSFFFFVCFLNFFYFFLKKNKYFNLFFNKFIFFY